MCSCDLSDFPFGKVITGTDIADPGTIPDGYIQNLKDQIKLHRLVILRGQNKLTMDQFLDLCSRLGEFDDRGFEQHSKSPNPHILSVSNDETFGFRNVGTSGFHIDGGFLEEPNEYSIYRIVQTTLGTPGTVFISCKELYENLSEQTQKKWERLHVVRSYKQIKRCTNERGFVLHPLVYSHPVTGEKTVYLAQGKVSTYVWDYRSPQEEECSRKEADLLTREIDGEIQRHSQRLAYHHKYLPGDVVITDNLALGHMAHPDTQLSPDEIGLRVLHRVVTKGRFKPMDYRSSG